jgi:hypothetical protein
MKYYKKKKKLLTSAQKANIIISKMPEGQKEYIMLWIQKVLNEESKIKER